MRAVISIPEKQRNKVFQPATAMHGMSGRIIGLQGRCATFQPDGWGRKYEFVPMDWIAPEAPAATT